MQIQVKGKQIDVGDALRGHAEDKLADAAGKYFDRAVDAAITFSRSGHDIRADAQIHLPTGMKASAHGSATDPYVALDNCVGKLEKQLRRYKRRLKDHHASRKDPIEALAASAYVIAGDDSEDEPNSLDPVIVAETTMSVQTLSVGEAVMQMELAGAAFLMFRNERNGEFNVVFRRDDGNVGWIDPELTRSNGG